MFVYFVWDTFFSSGPEQTSWNDPREVLSTFTPSEAISNEVEEAGEVFCPQSIMSGCLGQSYFHSLCCQVRIECFSSFNVEGSSFEWNLDKTGWFSSDTLVVRASFPSGDQVDSPFLSQILFNLLNVNHLLWIWSLRLLWKSPAWVWVRKALCSCVYQWYYSKCLLVWCTGQCLSHKT